MRNATPLLILALLAMLPLTVGCTAKERQETPADVDTTPAKPLEPAPTPGLLLDPSKLNETAPDLFKAEFETSKGRFVVEVHRDWAPRGADRFYNLVKNGFYDDVRFFRVIAGFMAQFGMSGDPKLTNIWQNAQIDDDPVRQSNVRGMVTYAMGGPNTRTTQLFINYQDNSRLDADGFSPFGVVVDDGMSVVDSLHSGYGEGAPRGSGPRQGRIAAEGNEYLDKDFPDLDKLIKVRIVE